MKTPALTFLLALFLITLPAGAQGQNNNNKNNKEDDEEEVQKDQDSNAEEAPLSKRFWSVVLPGGEYTVGLDRISSVSMHEYVLDSQLVVTEMVIDTNGRALARFYHVRSILESVGSGTAARVADRVKDVVDRAGQRANTDVHNLPLKNYPTTSHAGMIEYRLMNLNDLKAVFNSAQGAWESGQGKKITVKSPNTPAGK
ncbi:hypothetical protein [Haloferula sp. BvORR071]|uniref:hypothetical protein n=1 Tax=Haloferula sp. BvORR071 TaxID=1396141 RepID=UPI002240FF12|nr:hypothetical protein [Haloferula sp. BvORR071]